MLQAQCMQVSPASVSTTPGTRIWWSRWRGGGMNPLSPCATRNNKVGSMQETLVGFLEHQHIILRSHYPNRFVLFKFFPSVRAGAQLKIVSPSP